MMAIEKSDYISLGGSYRVLGKTAVLIYFVSFCVSASNPPLRFALFPARKYIVGHHHYYTLLQCEEINFAAPLLLLKLFH